MQEPTEQQWRHAAKVTLQTALDFIGGIDLGPYTDYGEKLCERIRTLLTTTPRGVGE